jgi:hypothetical protein
MSSPSGPSITVSGVLKTTVGVGVGVGVFGSFDGGRRMKERVEDGKELRDSEGVKEGSELKLRE